MVGPVKIRRVPPLTLALLACVACKDDSSAALFIDDLCQRRAEDVCPARVDCCEAPPSEQGCLAADLNSCVTQRTALEKNSALTYDSEQAARVLAEQRGSLDGCGPAFSIGRFFRGTGGNGAACERDAQCASDQCDLTEGVCATNDSLALCSPLAGPADESANQPTE